jgi:hypothetical protein
LKKETLPESYGKVRFEVIESSAALLYPAPPERGFAERRKVPKNAQKV